LVSIDRRGQAFEYCAEVLQVGPDVAIVDESYRAAQCSWTIQGADEIDVLRLSLIYRTDGAVARWHGSDRRVAVGGLSLVGRTAGGWSSSGRLQFISVAVARSALPIESALIDRFTESQAHRQSSVVHSSIRPMLAGMVGRLSTVGRTAGSDLATVWQSLFTLMIHSALTDARDADGVAPARRLQALAFIDQHLGDPELGVDLIAAALHVSRRTLYKAFADDPEGIAGSIRHHRMVAAKRMLTNPIFRHYSIAEVGAAVGLPNRTHFGRLFRRAYGESPGDGRRHIQSAGPTAYDG
jgi:AraC-like DNA-binding protein